MMGEGIMSLKTFTARATTCDVVPGSEESASNGSLKIRGRTFTDVVESSEPDVAGTNRPTLDMDLHPVRGEGWLHGRFVLTPSKKGGTWEGELTGRFEGGLVRATGLARGTGRLSGAVLHIEYRQVPDRAGAAPCADPKAFFEMSGTILAAS
jgi:hypothetical protein